MFTKVVSIDLGLKMEDIDPVITRFKSPQDLFDYLQQGRIQYQLIQVAGILNTIIKDDYQAYAYSAYLLDSLPVHSQGSYEGKDKSLKYMFFHLMHETALDTYMFGLAKYRQDQTFVEPKPVACQHATNILEFILFNQQ